MTPRELREVLVSLLPSQLEELLHEELAPELRAHVPAAPAAPATRVQAVIVLAEQDPALMMRFEAAVRVIVGGGAGPRAPEAGVRADEDSRLATRKEDVLFSWVHFSDLHFGYGSAEHQWDQRLVLQEIAKDLGRVTKEADLRPDAIFVTGDIAFSGSTRKPGEYEDATSWLLSVAKSVGLSKEGIFVVPGNHDVQRSVDTADKDVGRLVRLLRSGEESLDNALGDGKDAGRLRSRLDNYLAFAKAFGPAGDPAGENGLFWCHQVAAPRLWVRIAGLNTALLAANDEDRGKLRLGKEQLAKALNGGPSEGPTVVLVLTHHPFHGDWLCDEKDAGSWVRNHAHVHLCGHVHEAAAEQVISGGGKSFITVTAGASYGDAAKGGAPASHGYNLAALIRGAGGKLRLAVWPRRWSPKNADFRTDVDNVDEGIRSVRDIGGVLVRIPGPAPKKRVAQPALEEKRSVRPSEPVAKWISSAVEQHRWIPVLGFQERYKIRLSLDEIFVPLQVRAGRRTCTPMKGKEDAEDFIESREVDLPGALRMTSANPDTVGLVVLGDPGAGKTTLLKQLFLRVAREGSAAVGLPEGLLPVLLRCSQIEAGDLKPRGLAAAIEREAERNQFAHCGEAMSKEEPLLFLLDGLDEVREETVRERLAEWLCDEVTRWKGARFVVTCRFAAWGRKAPLLDQRFVPVDVLMLDDASVRSYVHKWFGAVEGGLDPLGGREKAAARAKESADKLLEQILSPKRQSHFRLREMTQNPLLLSTLCLVHHSDWRLPDRRGDLYDRCISLLLETWAERREGRPNLPDKAARQVLQPLAWAMHSAEVKEWPAEKVEATIKKPLSELPDLPQSPGEFLERARNDCGVLASKDIGHFEFFHLSFQEYLAAVHAKEHGLVKELASHAAKPWWREVILLAAAQPGVLGDLVREMAATSGLEPHRELLRECVSEAFQLKAEPFLEVIDQGLKGEWGGTATVRAVLEVLGPRAPAEVVERARQLRNQKDVAVSAMALRVLGDREDAQPAGVLTVGQPFREKTTKMSFLWVPPGRFWMGSSKTREEANYDDEANDREIPAREVTLTEGFWIGEYPVTNEQYGVFLEATGTEAPKYWRDRQFNAPDQPLVGVNWEESRAFNAWLSGQANLGEAFLFDLPTEAEWEYVARGGEGRKYPWGNEAPTAERVDYGRTNGKPAPVGTHPSGRSKWGAQDMAGDVWEWCLDGWQDNLVTMMTKTVNPCHLLGSGAPRVVRGGSWDDGPGYLRCARRNWGDPGNRLQNLGFRVVCRGFRRHMGA